MDKSKQIILLVDNNPSTLRLEVSFLQDSNFPTVSYDIITSSNEDEAAKKIDQHNGNLVVVVPNNLIAKEENSGIELIETLRKDYPKTPFVLVKLGHNNDVEQVEKLLKSKGLDVPYVEDGDEQLVEAIKEGFKKLEKKTILVVDNHSAVLDATKMLLETLLSEHEIITASSKEEAKKKIEQHQGNLFVLTDNNMETENAGVDLCQEFASRDNIKFAIYTSAPDVAKRTLTARKIDGVTCFSKGDNPIETFNSIVSLVKGEKQEENQSQWKR